MPKKKKLPTYQKVVKSKNFKKDTLKFINDNSDNLSRVRSHLADLSRQYWHKQRVFNEKELEQIFAFVLNHKDIYLQRLAVHFLFGRLQKPKDEYLDRVIELSKNEEFLEHVDDFIFPMTRGYSNTKNTKYCTFLFDLMITHQPYFNSDYSFIKGLLMTYGVSYWDVQSEVEELLEKYTSVFEEILEDMGDEERSSQLRKLIGIV